MDRVTIENITYTDEGIYVDGKLLFKDGVLYYNKLDYVKVTRCRDCKYYIDPKEPDLKPYCTNTFEGTAINPNTGRWVKPDGFCAWGKKQ